MIDSIKRFFGYVRDCDLLNHDLLYQENTVLRKELANLKRKQTPDMTFKQLKEAGVTAVIECHKEGKKCGYDPVYKDVLIKDKQKPKKKK